MTELYTIGHSNRPLEDFLMLLKKFSIKNLIDIRAVPRSRFVPWSNQKNLTFTLQENNITYLHMPELGGRREPKIDSVNTGWKNSGLRGFADYMQTQEFHQALQKLNQLVLVHPTAIMCSEGNPLQCHRQLISDAEVIRKIRVIHLVNLTKIEDHIITPFAVVDSHQQIIYPSGPTIPLSFLF